VKTAADLPVHPHAVAQVVMLRDLQLERDGDAHRGLGSPDLRHGVMSTHRRLEGGLKGG
jgi:hypothetical protein